MKNFKTKNLKNKTISSALIFKGACLLFLTSLYTLYLIMRGGRDLIGLITLKDYGVKSNQTLVYGLICVFLSAGIIIAVTAFIKSCILELRKTDNKSKETVKEYLLSFKNTNLYKLFLLFPVLGVLVFTILPLTFMICVAFTNFATSESLGVIPNIVDGVYLSWTGLTTFIKLFELREYSRAFISVLSWTVIWAALATVTCYFGGLFLAMLINKKSVKYKTLFRSVFVLSMAIPQLVTLRVMYAMFHDYGPINSLLLNWGLISSRISFWGNTFNAKTLIILVNTWVGIPYFMLLLSGLLINIPTDLYEYARVEGASKSYIFRRITMPYLLFMTLPLIITTFVSNMNNFNVIWLLTNGGPSGLGTGGVAGGTDILITWLFKLTMQNNPDYNMGSAIGIIMFIISLTISLIVYRNSSSYKREGDFA